MRPDPFTEDGSAEGHEEPFVQTVVVTWNRRDDLLRLLASLAKLDYPARRLAVLVVDNASEDGTVEAVQERFPAVRILRNPENLGGAGGFNAGMGWALTNRPDAEYLWLLDNDALVTPDALTALVSVMADRPNAAVCGSRIVDIEDRRTLIEIGGFIDFRKGGVRRNIPSSDALADPAAVFAVDYVAACSLLARTAHVREAGLWRESFFIYWDDMEWGARFAALGRDVLAVSGSVVYHPSWTGRAAGNSAIWRDYYRTRNSLAFFSVYTSGARRKLLLCKMALRFLAIAVLTGLRSRTRHSMAFIKGISDFLEGRSGKAEFSTPPNDLAAHLERNGISDAALFVPDESASTGALAMAEQLHVRFPKLCFHIIAPESRQAAWEGANGVAAVLPYRQTANGRIYLGDMARMVRFAGRARLLIAPETVPRVLATRFAKVARVDVEDGSVIGIEAVGWAHLARIVSQLPKLLLRMLAKS